ncbi:MAG: thioredoxin-dependent thiol peroxidase [Thermoleophilia bacterium]|nr:thioredoxin-dependent thiol peroxidase [Thermoleophilia bacterium]
MVEAGQPAPDFELTSDTGETVRLADLRGRPVVLYFYPRDETPGCTRQACELRDAHAAFEERGATILGVSPDDEASHARFREHHDLPFTLLADPDKTVATAYGVWRERTLYGKRRLGIVRSTFVIGPDGTIIKALRGVRPDGHAQRVLAALP